MKKKWLALLLAVVMIISCTTAVWMISTNAASGAYSVANAVAHIDTVTGVQTLHSEKLSNFTAAFDYTPKSDQSVWGIRYDYDSSLKKTAVNEDFEAYVTGDKAYNTITVTAGSGRGMIGSVGQWQDGAATIFSGTDYDATFWLHQNNGDWGKMNIKVKDGVQFIFRGNKHSGDANTIGLYKSSVTVNNNPAAADLLASFSLKDYGYSYNQGKVYYRITVTKENIKMYISPVNDFDGLEPVIDYTLPEELAKEASELTFSQGNTGLLLDEIKVIDPTKSGYETNTETIRTYEKYEEVFSEDFEDETATDAVSGTAKVIKNGEDNVLDFGDKAWNVKHSITEDLPQNSSIVFHAHGGNPDWENIHIYFNNDLKIQFLGSKHGVSAGSYTARLVKGSDVYATANTFGNLTTGGGTYIRIDNQDGLVSLYVSANGNFENAAPIIQQQIHGYADKGRLYIHKEGNATFRVDDIKVYDFGTYTEDTVKTFSGEYGVVLSESDKVTAFEVNGTDFEKIKTADFKYKAGQKYRIAVLRDRTNLTVTVDGKEAFKATVPYDTANHIGEIAIEPANADISNVDLYDSGRITFEDRGAVLVPFDLAENIGILATSHKENKVEKSKNDINLSIAADSVPNYLGKTGNASVNTSAILAEEVGDLVLDFYIKDGRNDWVEDTIMFGVPDKITFDEVYGYQHDPWGLYKSGYALRFTTGAVTATNKSYNYNLCEINGGALSSIKKRTDPIDYHWGSSAGHVRIERKGDTVRVYTAPIGEALTLIDEVKAEKYLLGNVYWYHRLANANMMNIRAYDTANRTAHTAGDGANAEPTRLVAFYSTTKTDKDILIEESQSTYEKIGPWYYIKNPHRNATYLKQSLTGDVELTNMDMSFEYYGGGHWMTNTFYFASSNKYGTTSYALTIKGNGTAGLSADKCNLILTRNYYGKSVVLGKATVPNLTVGVFKFHITINNGKINVLCKPKNAPDSEGTVLSGDNGGFDIRGGVYMYLYDDCYARLKDIVIYNGVDAKNAEQPDLSTPKETVLKNDFEDANNIPAKLFKNEKGVTVKHNTDKGMLQFDTNHNNYIQSTIEPATDWLEDLTIQFDYLGHRGDWNLNFFAWHCSRKSGDRYSSLYLAVLGNNVAGNEKAGDNIAKVKGANIQLVASENGKKTCLGWAALPDINGGRQHSIRITQEGGLTKVWVWPKEQDMPTEPTIVGTNYHPELCYGGFFVHSWCGNFSIDNLEILNYPNYVIPEPVSHLSKPIGEIFRVDRILEVVEEPSKGDDKTQIVDIESEKSNLGLILAIVIPACVVLLAGLTVILIVILKKRKKQQ